MYERIERASLARNLGPVALALAPEREKLMVTGLPDNVLQYRVARRAIFIYPGQESCI